MYYEIHGQGRPVLLLHGGIADHSFWPRTLQDIAKDHRVIAPEQMGHGHTADLPAREFSYAQMAENTAALLEQLDVKTVDVVGRSKAARRSQGGLRRRRAWNQRAPRRPLEAASAARNTASAMPASASGHAKLHTRGE
jgi:hypothetical protein